MGEWDVPAWVTALIVAVVAPGAWFTARGAKRSTDHARIKDLESRVDKVEARNATLWQYNRDLIDHIYKGSPPPPPPIPEGAL